MGEYQRLRARVRKRVGRRRGTWEGCVFYIEVRKCGNRGLCDLVSFWRVWGEMP